jgi:hypothetical protein
MEAFEQDAEEITIMVCVRPSHDVPGDIWNEALLQRTATLKR